MADAVEAFIQAMVATKAYAKCCRCGAVEVPGKGTLDEAGMTLHAHEIFAAVRKGRWSPPLKTTEGVEAYAAQLRHAGWHISKFHPTEASLCPSCLAKEERSREKISTRN